MEIFTLERYRSSYAVAAALLQVLAVAGCNRPDESATLSSDREPSTVAATNQNAVTDNVVAMPAAPAGTQRLILAFGDSLYAGYGVARGQSLPDVVQANLRRAGTNATIVNAGVSGDTSAAGRRRFVFALDSMARKPDLILLGLGGNDVLRQISPAETRANLTAMMDEAKRRDIPVILTGMRAPPNLGADYQRAFDTIWPDLAKAYDARLYPFILDGVIGQPALMQRDYVHPNASGIDHIADRLTPIVMGQLGKG